jgi:peptidoglycan/xylan/chitin deacetylase (PgdA/CDA1 family)
MGLGVGHGCQNQGFSKKKVHKVSDKLFDEQVYLRTGRKLDLHAAEDVINIPAKYSSLFGNEGEKLSLTLKDIAKFVSYHLLRNEESGSVNLDKRGRFDHNKSTLVKNKLGQSPIIDELISEIIEQLGLERRQLWPDAKKAAICLTHDVDSLDGTSYLCLRKGWWYSKFLQNCCELRFAQAATWRSKIKRWKQLREDPIFAIDKWMEVEDKLGFRSTFFFFGLKHSLSREGRRYSYKDQKVRDATRRLCKSGWEIGLHGAYYRHLDLDYLKEQKQRLEDAAGNEITGVRQHFLRVRFPKSWDLYHRAGFKYSSNMGWSGGFNGFRAGTCFPNHPLHENGFCEIPFQLMDLPIIKNPETYFNLFLDYVTKVKSVGGCMVIDFHQEYFDESESPGVNKTYRMILDYLSGDKELWIKPLREVHNHFSSLLQG